jgi:hypothetical protein
MSTTTALGAALAMGVIALVIWALSRAMPQGPRMVLAVAAVLTATAGVITALFTGLNMLLTVQT